MTDSFHPFLSSRGYVRVSAACAGGAASAERPETGKEWSRFKVKELGEVAYRDTGRDAIAAPAERKEAAFPFSS